MLAVNLIDFSLFHTELLEFSGILACKALLTVFYLGIFGGVSSGLIVPLMENDTAGAGRKHFVWRTVVESMYSKLLFMKQHLGITLLRFLDSKSHF